MDSLPAAFTRTVDRYAHAYSLAGSGSLNNAASSSPFAFISEPRTPSRKPPTVPLSPSANIVTKRGSSKVNNGRKFYALQSVEELMDEVVRLQDIGDLESASVALEMLNELHEKEDQRLRKQMELRGMKINEGESVVGSSADESENDDESVVSDGTMGMMNIASPVSETKANSRKSASVASSIGKRSHFNDDDVRIELEPGSKTKVVAIEKPGTETVIPQISVFVPEPEQNVAQEDKKAEAQEPREIKKAQTLSPSVSGIKIQEKLTAIPSSTQPAEPKVATVELEEEEKKLREIRRIIASLGIDSLLLETDHVITPLEEINARLRSKVFVTPNSSDAVDAEILSPSLKVSPNQKRMVSKAGMLMIAQAGRFFKSSTIWKTKFVVLTGRFVLLFENENSRKCIAIIELSGSTVEPVATQSRDKRGIHVEFEVRVRELRTGEIHRFKPVLKRANNKSHEEASQSNLLKEDAAEWAASLNNNVAIANKNLDLLKKDLKSLREIDSQCNCRRHRSTIASFFSSRKDCRQCSDSKKDSIKILATHNPIFPERNRFQHIKEAEIIDEECEKNHFSGGTPGGSSNHIGTDIGKRELDEDVYAHYKVLNMSPKATDLMIKKSYRQLARDLHPDKNINSEQQAERTSKFARISRAFDVLKFKDTRQDYDNCEQVKDLLRRGIVVRVHRLFENPETKIVFLDSKFLNIYAQDVQYGTVLHEGFRSIELRFVTHVYSGLEGFVASRNSQSMKELFQQQNWDNSSHDGIPLDVVSRTLTLHGERLGEQDWHLELPDDKTRDQLLYGIRKLRCDFSELFKQRLDEMHQAGLR